MKSVIWRIITVVFAVGAACAQGNVKISFEGERLGAMPEGWSVHQHGAGKAVWQVLRGDEKSGKVLAQVGSENPNKHFNMAVCNRYEVRDVELSVRLKAVSGKLDQGGGFVWRYQDEGNHYIVRANPLENNVVLYRMEGGVRTDLPLVGKGKTYGVKVPEMGSNWHTLKLVAKGTEFTVFLDGTELFRVRDETFKEAGKVGLWTKADAVTWFDEFVVKAGGAS